MINVYIHGNLAFGDDDMTQDPVFERIERLLVDRGKSQQSMLADLGMSRSAYANWKSGQSKSYLKRIDGIADFLDVSPNYLLRGIETESTGESKTAAEDELIRLFRQLNVERQECVIQVVRVLLLEKSKN